MRGFTRTIAALVLGWMAAGLVLAEPNPQVLMRTSAGDIRIELYPAESPLAVGSSRVDLQACKLEYSIVSPK